jgi:small subunit ribosomal protein S9
MAQTKSAPAKKPAVKKVSAQKKPAVKKAARAEVNKEKPVIEAGVVLAVEPKGEFLKAIGRRKEASAQVKIFPSGKGAIIVNGKELKQYFPVFNLQESVLAPIKLAGREGKIDVSALVRGGGIRGQAEAVRLGVARALRILDESLHTTIKKAGFLTRDPRVKERKKYGLKKARRAPQWAKR